MVHIKRKTERKRKKDRKEAQKEGQAAFPYMRKSTKKCKQDNGIFFFFLMACRVMYFPVCVCAQPGLTLGNPRVCSPPAFPVHGIILQEYWSGLLFPPVGDIRDSGIESASTVSPALAGTFFTAKPSGEPQKGSLTFN